LARKSLIPAGSYLSAEEVADQNDPGLLSRIVQKDSVKHGRRPESTPPPEPEAEPESAGSINATNEVKEAGRQYDKSYGNMTSHTENNTADNIPIRPESNTYGRKYIKQGVNQESHTEGLTVSSIDVQPHDRMASLPPGHTSDQTSGQQPGNTSDQPSVRAAIQATIQKAGQATEVLKTVTIKLAPSLDRRVEEHCFRTGRKKQEVVRDALLLYFEAIEEAEGEGE
jgi:hypothetical protein